MKLLVSISAVVILVAGYAVVAADSATLVQLDSKDFGDANCFVNMKIVEFERNTNTSKLRFTRMKRGSSVGTSMFIMRGFYEAAKARGAEYFVNLKEWDDKDGTRIFIAGFTNTKDADLKKEFGEEYDYNNEYGQKRICISISQLKVLFEKPKSRI